MKTAQKMLKQTKVSHKTIHSGILRYSIFWITIIGIGKIVDIYASPK